MKTAPFVIPKQRVVRAYHRVKSSAGAAGVDHQSLGYFEKDLENNAIQGFN